MKRLSLFLASAAALAGVVWAVIRRWGGALFFEPRGPGRGLRALFEDEGKVRREAQRARIEGHRAASEKEIRCQADDARKRVEEKFRK
jgi:hypothetical protein